MLRQNTTTLATGLALFSMFFGAGNVTFPLLVGHITGIQSPVALAGLCVTAVAIPVFGLIATILYQSDYKQFFARLGRWPGALLIFVSMLLLGPLVGIPRTIAVAYSTLNYAVPDLSRFIFSLLFCGAAYAVTVRKSALVDILGMVLTPILLLLILLIIGVGLLYPQPMQASQIHHNAFWYGVREGYNTLDLVAALFFSGVILANIKTHMGEQAADERVAARESIKAGLIGGGLLAIVYFGLSLTSAMYTNNISFGSIDPAQLLAVLTEQVLGHYAAPVAAVVVLLACFTTAVTLACIAADYIKELHPSVASLKYRYRLLAVLGLSFMFSLLGFTKLMLLVAPVIVICYPVYIWLCVANTGHKLFGWQMVKGPALVVFLVSLGMYYLG